jgi:polar amino acid transport system substrate-binding protein
MELAIQNGVAGVHLLDENLGDTVKVAVGISPVSPIPGLKDKINASIAQLREDGTLSELSIKYFGNDITMESQGE